MMTITEAAGTQAIWFVGSAFGGTDDQTARFLADGIWEISNPSKADSAMVNSMNVGDRIAIKAAYVRKHGLPFDNRGQTVSVLAIKATGTIVSNPRDGERVQVRWSVVDPPREWYFYTYRATIWRVVPGDWKADGLIAFTFNSQAQDIDRFRNAPYWRERFGPRALGEERFGWTKFYVAVADKLLQFRNDRGPLVTGIRDIANRVEGIGYLSMDRYKGGKKGFVRDICPFTTFGLFNRGLTKSNRQIIAGELAKFLGVAVPVPESFEGVPLLNNMKSWYFPYEVDRDPDHIDSLWALFESAMKYADSEGDEFRGEFANAFDKANGRDGVAWNLTFGLYWARPWSFMTLDHKSKVYITEKLSVPMGQHGPKKLCNSRDYLELLDNLENRFQDEAYPAHSYPELSWIAWLYKGPGTDGIPVKKDGESGEVNDEEEAQNSDEETDTPAPIVAYDVDGIVEDGCFLEKVDIEKCLARLRSKKNLILQGAPGTGKTWLAKRLAFALMKQKNESRVRAVQFHPNLSYEDFVRGWRPTGEGKLALVDGVFMEAVKAAGRITLPFVVVIEEINRGNPSQIFGEMLTLLEASKRTPSEALELCYPDQDGKHRSVHIPENLYVIGTMNIADRSLALVDLALRRRFAFVELEPRLGTAWRKWVTSKCNVDEDLATSIETRIAVLNATITTDPRLGAQFRIGHSFVTPSSKLENGETQAWFAQVVDTEIGPQLDEYWFDAPAEAKKARELLLKGW